MTITQLFIGGPGETVPGQRAVRPHLVVLRHPGEPPERPLRPHGRVHRHDGARGHPGHPGDPLPPERPDSLGLWGTTDLLPPPATIAASRTITGITLHVGQSGCEVNELWFRLFSGLIRKGAFFDFKFKFCIF